MHEPRTTQQGPHQQERFTLRDIPSFIAAFAALITACVAVAAFFVGRATGAPTPTATVTVTAPAATVTVTAPASDTSGGSSASSLEKALLSAKAVGSGMGAPSSIDSFLSSVMQNAEICTGQPADGGWPTVSEELTDSPKSTAIFTERIVNWGSMLKAAQSITSDETALGQYGCNFTSNQTTQEFGAPTSGTAPKDCGSGGELVASVELASSVPNGVAFR